MFGDNLQNAATMSKSDAIYAPNQKLEDELPVLVLDVKDGVSRPPRVGHNEFHWHDDVQFIMDIVGKAVIDAPGQHIVMEPGQMALIAPGTLHRVTSGLNSLYTSFVFPQAMLQLGGSEVLYAECVSARLGAMAEGVVALDGALDWHKAVYAFLDTARSMLLSADAESPAKYTSAALLCAAWGTCVQHVSFGAQAKGDRVASARLKACIAFIEENFAASVTVAQIADAASVSEAECVRCFRSLTGTSPHAYLVAHRVKRASQMLLDTDMPLSVIAAECGFSSPGHFTRTFKEHASSTPSEYRRTFASRA